MWVVHCNVNGIHGILYWEDFDYMTLGILDFKLSTSWKICFGKNLK